VKFVDAQRQRRRRRRGGHGLTVVDVLVGMNPGKAKADVEGEVLGARLHRDIGKPLFAHYTYARTPRPQARQDGEARTIHGPCGTAHSSKLTQLPVKKPKPGPYVIQFDANPAFKYQQGVYVERSVFVYPSRKR